MDSPPDRVKFEEKVWQIAAKPGYSFIWTEDMFHKTLKELLKASRKEKKKTPHEYRLLKRYSTVSVDGKEILTEDGKFVIPLEQMNDKLLQIHLKSCVQ